LLISGHKASNRVVGERLCKHKYSAYCVDDIEDVAKDEEGGKAGKTEATDANGVHPSTVIAVTSPLLNHDAPKSDEVDAKTDADVAENAKTSQEKVPFVSFSKPEQVTNPDLGMIIHL